ncbi:MAG TPA: MFS transporter [Verrucomicrobiota bacterium]|nr:MFS transporter [Verrucomicrobiota bacterium]HNU49500.1 MFS transporter [Verrucomicrobiota bacterium]
MREGRLITPQQWRSGIAAWLGWTFDGLDMHLYTLVYAQFVAQLVHASTTRDPRVGYYASIIQGAFLLGWALGGGLFGRIGDRLGRSRTLCLTILTYAAFTGLSSLAQEWWQLCLFRFLSALGIGGEWAVGASLLAETWPRRWRPWIAAVLQTGVNVGILMAVFAHWAMAGIVSTQPRWLFVVGVLPALLVLWVRRAVPETEEWSAARRKEQHALPRIRDLFRPEIRRTTLLVVAVCALGLTGHWAFMFWNQIHFKNLPDVIGLSDREKGDWGRMVLYLVIVSSILGNFVAAAFARRFGYRRVIVWMCAGYFLAMCGCYAVEWPHRRLYYLLALPGFFQGLFALFTMYLPPLFPTLLRTTGAGFCYNIGRVVSAFGVVFFGLATNVGDYRLTLLLAGGLFVPAAITALFLPERRDAGPG